MNLVFALQTGLDLLHLWGGAELPEGVTPAANAQQAAYILVVSALLAAALVLVAAPAARGRRDGKARLILALIHLWIAQNVVLVLSAMLRLDLYVGLYGLTELRIAAFVWMVLVVIGLVLIECRIVFGKTGGWLVRTNLIALGVALYAWSLVDVRAVVANHNVDHSYEVMGTGVPLDRDYLCGLGPSALPAIERFVRHRDGRPDWRSERRLLSCAAKFRLTLAGNSQDWRAWSFRDYRLRQATQQPRNARAGADHATDDPRGG